MKGRTVTIKTIALALLASSSAIAGTMGPIQAASTWTPMITISGGPAWTSPGKTTTLFLQPDVQKTYTADKNNQNVASGSLAVGFQKQLSQHIFTQLGLALAASTSAKIRGSIWEDADPAFNNYTYQYKVNHSHLALQGKLLADVGHGVLPYVNGSLGAGINRSREFTITSRISQEIPAPGFQGKNLTSFTYTLGLGLQKILTPHLQAGIGYEFANWGKSQLAPAPGQTIGTGLSLAHLYTHSIQLSLSYLI